MAISISSSAQNPSVAAVHSPSDPSTVDSSNVASPAADSVKLSQAAQVHLMKQQGQGLAQIASNLGVAVTVVDGYLGIAVPKAAAPVPAAASTSVPAAAPVASGASPNPAKG